jgi:hypothetical protein
MDEDSAGQFSVFNHGPSSTARGIQLVSSLPGKFNPLLPVVGFQTAIHLTLFGSPSNAYRATASSFWPLVNMAALFRDRAIRS